MSPEQAEEFRYNILDITKVWPHKEFPLHPVGKLVLDRNPENYFAEVEQVAFSPSHLVPGIEPSADLFLQARLFSYPDAQRYRLGANYQQLPVNRPLVPVANFQRDGFMAFENQGTRPNYQSSLVPLAYRPKSYEQAAHETWLGAANMELSSVTERAYFCHSFVGPLPEPHSVVDFEQPRALWQNVFDDMQKAHFVSNMAAALGSVKSPVVKARQRKFLQTATYYRSSHMSSVVSIFAAVDQDIADRICKAIDHLPVKPLVVAPAMQAIRFQVHERPDQKN